MRAVSRIDVHQHSADTGGRRLKVHPLGAVRGPHAHAIAGPYAQSGEAPSCALDFSRQVAVLKSQALMPGDNCVTFGIAPDGVIERLPNGFAEQRKARAAGIAEHVGRIILWAESEQLMNASARKRCSWA